MNWIRKRIYWIAGCVVGGMIFWLVNTAVTLHSVQTESAGILFGRQVPLTDYLKSMQAVTHQAILAHGDRYRKNVSMQEMEERAWERLIFLSEAGRKGIRVSNPEVIAEIERSPLFRNSRGEFDEQGYGALMQYTLGATPRAFEEETREDLMIQKLVQTAIGSSPATEEELKKRFQEKGGAIRVEYALFPSMEQAREVAEASRQDPARLAQTARKTGLKMSTTDLFKRDGKIPGLDNVAALLSLMAETQPGETSGPFKAGKQWGVARLIERKPADEKDFPAARPMLEKELLGQKRLRNYIAWYEDLLKRAKPQRKPLPAGR